MIGIRKAKKKTPSRKGPANGMAANGSRKPRNPDQEHPFDRKHLVGSVILLCVLFFLTLLSGLTFKPGVKLFVAGDIATQDVTAGQDLLIEDKESTRVKREQVAKAQPPVYDISRDELNRLNKRIGRIFHEINAIATTDELEQVRWKIAEWLNSEITKQAFSIWRNNEVQNLVFIRVLPLLNKRLMEGVVRDKRELAENGNGILRRDPLTSIETLILDLDQFHGIPEVLEEVDEYLIMEFQKPLRTRKAILELVGLLLEPSLTLNKEITRDRAREVMSAVKPVYSHIKQGELVVREGQRITVQDQVKLQALYSKQSEYFKFYKPVGVLLLALLFSAGLVLSPSGRMLKPLANRDAVLLSMVLLVFVGLAKILGIIEIVLADRWEFLSGGVPPYVMPVAGAVGVLALFFPTQICFFASLLISFLCCQMVSGNLDLFSFYFLGAMIYTVLVKRAQTRFELLRSLLPLLVFLFVCWAGAHFLHYRDLGGMGMEAVFVLFNGLFTLMMVFALSPIVELVFGFTSRFKLMELMNLEQPLLQEVMVATPGTYHHSLVVANMVEAGARAIGANALLCKVAALYHDIGKLKNPQYFIENQFGGENKHDKLAPSMSALILISHVKKGVELAREHKLGQEITDIIEQHHGTSLISYFYNKAVEQAEARGGDPVNQNDYRYPGPKPQTKEAGVVLLADVIEASSRTLMEPTPSRIRNHIDSITKRVFTEGQLDESDLTLKDLNLLGETFHRILTGIFHQRIDYPEQGKEQAKDQPKDQAKEAKNPAKDQPKEQAKDQGKVQGGDALTDHPLPGFSRPSSARTNRPESESSKKDKAQDPDPAATRKGPLQ